MAKIPSAETHLISLPGYAAAVIDLYLKDESTHPTGSLKHRASAVAVPLCAVPCSAAEGSTIVESPRSSTAMSEAYFAGLLGLPFVAVMPRSTPNPQRH